jgi:hypothetical protein
MHQLRYAKFSHSGSDAISAMSHGICFVGRGTKKSITASGCGNRNKRLGIRSERRREETCCATTRTNQIIKQLRWYEAFEYVTEG